MKYIYKDDKVERVFDVSYDEEELKTLLDNVVKKLSYREDGGFVIEPGPKFDNNGFSNGPVLPNGDQEYENVTGLMQWMHEGSLGYPGDSIKIKGTRVVPPRLASIIGKILSDDPKGINDLMEYPKRSECIPIDERIETTNKEIDKISNFDTDNKIGALERLKQLCDDKKNGRYFDTKLLKSFYLETLSIINLRLDTETIINKNDNKILLKDYINNKN